MLLLKFPSVLSTRNFSPSTAATISLVVVLPTEPVMHTKGMSNCFLYHRARSRSARWVERTFT